MLHRPGPSQTDDAEDHDPVVADGSSYSIVLAVATGDAGGAGRVLGLSFVCEVHVGGVSRRRFSSETRSLMPCARLAQFASVFLL